MRCIVLWIPAYAGMTVKGAGNDGRHALPLWIADQVRNDGLGYVVGVVLFTLTFDSSPIKGEGDWLVLSCCLPGRLPSGLRIKSAMT